MKTNPLNPIVLPLCLLAALSPAVMADDKAAKDALVKLAASKRAAVVRLAVKRTPTIWEGWSMGVFISKDGLASRKS